MTGLAAERWERRLYSSGWSESSGGALMLREPATGIELGEVGLADPEDVRAAAARAAGAQAGWAVHPLAARAPIFRKAAAFIESNKAAVSEWIVRETGSVPAKAAVEIKIAIGELHEAAAMVLQPRGLLLPSEQGVTSIARRVPHGVVGVISPFNFPLILSMRAVAGARDRQCGGAQARSADAGDGRFHHRARLRRGGAASGLAPRAPRRSRGRRGAGHRP